MSATSARASCRQAGLHVDLHKLLALAVVVLRRPGDRRKSFMLFSCASRDRPVLRWRIVIPAGRTAAGRGWLKSTSWSAVSGVAPEVTVIEPRSSVVLIVVS